MKKMYEVTMVRGPTRRILFSKVWRRLLWVTYKTDALLFEIICSRGIPHDGLSTLQVESYTTLGTLFSTSKTTLKRGNGQTTYLVYFLSIQRNRRLLCRNFIGTMPSGEKYQQFAGYLTEKYIDSNALFPLKFWASHCWQKMPATLFFHTNNIKIWFT
jgi:hypothetical protein